MDDISDGSARFDASDIERMGAIPIPYIVRVIVPAAPRYAAVAKTTTAALFVPRNDGAITAVVRSPF